MKFDKSAYDKQYAKDNIIRKFIPFNKTKDEDAVLLEWLATKGNITEYIKRLIIEDMKNNKA